MAVAVVCTLAACAARPPDPPASGRGRAASGHAPTASSATAPTTTAPTTTAPPATTSTTAPADLEPVAYHGNPAGDVNGYPCGGDLPPCYVLARESGGDPTIWNGGCHDGPCPGGSTASGLWQFLRTTWARFAGYLNAADAPPEVQNEKARLTWGGGGGCTHWAAC